MMICLPIGSCKANCFCRRNWATPRQVQYWIILLLAFACITDVRAGRNREHGSQRVGVGSNGGGGGGSDTTMVSIGGGIRSRSDRLRHHQPAEKYPMTIAKEEQHSEFMKGKICIGTNGRMSVPSNREHHFRNLRDRYTNCTYVDGNLELTWLQDTNLDLSFLQHIREVTGYVLISHVDVNIVLPRLQIIRGRTLFKLNILVEEFGLFVTYSQMHTLELPALRDILNGSVGLFNNYNLCHVRSINWDEIITGFNESFKYTYNFTSPERECPPCHASCEAGCWGEGAHNCQKFSKTNCSPQCSQGRCFGPKPRDCCHLFCAGGCTGPTQKDCLACRNFYDDGVCKQECPPMQKYNPTNYLWEPNPDGKYAYGATCVRNCPEHLLKDSGACVRTCPVNKTAIDGECVQCIGPCPKTCPGTGTVHSGNIDSFKDCTIIEGSLEILDQSFDGYQQVFTNFSFGSRFIKMHPDRLEVFSTLREVTGFINIQGCHQAFTNLSYFRNLEVIGGRQLMDTFFASLYIVKTKLKSLELSSLKRINSGAVVILENSELCFAQDVNWAKIKKTRDHPSMMVNNRNQTECLAAGLVCSEECSADGCWGSGPDQCLECKHFRYNGTCIKSCDSLPNIYKIDEKTCGACHPECKHSCTGPGADNCTSCRNVKDNRFCVPACPQTKYNQSGICVLCHESCYGCTGPRSTFGPQGCTKCEKAIIGDGISPVRCLKKEAPCPDGHYYDVIFPKEPTIIHGMNGLAGEATCRRCHPRCKLCTSYGFHEQACQKCAGYKRGEQCEDECPTDHYVDVERSECFPCHSECRGCTGPGPQHCVQCRTLKIFTGDDVAANAAALAAATNSLDGMSMGNMTVAFNCTASCPEDYPFKIYPTSELGAQPYCSAVQTHAGFLEQTAEAPVILLGALVGLFVVVVICVIVMWYCNKKTKESAEAAKLTKIFYEDAEPLRPSNVGPNLTRVHIIKEHQLRRSKLLGQGAFGAVYQGMWIMDDNNKLPVAIKIPLEMSGPQAGREFFEEAYIMASVEHPNLLNLLAVCMTTELMFVTQLMPQGSLLDYVKKKRKDIGSMALLLWSKQIASGMKYLEERRLVHRDLAARNVLVKHPGLVKITDFGLAKLLSQDSDEYKAAGGKMPIKWLALECIRNRVFTSKSDVWAFGVTIWELLTFGERPYGDVPAKEVPDLIECGERLVQPDICSLDVYMTLLGCWNLDAGLRPSFKDLEDVFLVYYRDPGRYLCIPNDSLLCLPSITSHDEKNLIRNRPAANAGAQQLDGGAAGGGAQSGERGGSGTGGGLSGGAEGGLTIDRMHSKRQHHHGQHNTLNHAHHQRSHGNQQLHHQLHLGASNVADGAAAGTSNSSHSIASGEPLSHHSHAATAQRYCPDPMKGATASHHMPMGDDVCDHKVCIGTLKLDLPLDEDDYLMPSGPLGCGSASGAGYMDLIGQPSCVDNPEYLIGAGAAIPTQTIGIPLAASMPMMMMPAQMAPSAAAAGGATSIQSSVSMSSVASSPLTTPTTVSPPTSLDVAAGATMTDIPKSRINSSSSSCGSLTGIAGHMSAAASLTVLPPATVPMHGMPVDGAQLVAQSSAVGLPIVGASTHVHNGHQHGDQVPSDHEYYNDLQRELQPLHRSETTV